MFTFPINSRSRGIDVQEENLGLHLEVCGLASQPPSWRQVSELWHQWSLASRSWDAACRPRSRCWQNFCSYRIEGWLGLVEGLLIFSKFMEGRYHLPSMLQVWSTCAGTASLLQRATKFWCLEHRIHQRSWLLGEPNAQQPKFLSWNKYVLLSSTKWHYIPN